MQTGNAKVRATLIDMLSHASFTFAYFWFSHRTGGREASA
ncbi:MAG: hypothetical protein JWQ11_4268 [Rhizobacter sp.]|nr:hypothetical protein [Rhizobacter sp.]